MNINYIDTLNYVSSSAGSNKTGGAIDIMKEDNPFQNYIYVTPRINLMEEVIRRCGEGSDREINPKKLISFHSGNTYKSSVGSEALYFINRLQNKSNHIIFITTTTFLGIVSRIKNKGNYKLIIDEEVETFWLQKFEAPIESPEALNLLEVFLDENEDEVNIKREKICEVNRILGEVKESYPNIYNNRTLKSILSIIKNDSIISYRLDIDDKGIIYIFSYLQPKYFMMFQEVTFLCAHFEHTTLYHLWKKEFKVNFEEHSLYSNRLNNLSEIQGNNVMIGWLLDDSDSASTSTLGSNSNTGKQGYHDEELVIDKILEYIDTLFKEENTLVAINNKYENKAKYYENFKVVSTAVSGLNCYSKINNVAVLATTNPIPIVANQLCKLLNIKNKE